MELYFNKLRKDTRAKLISVAITLTTTESHLETSASGLPAMYSHLAKLGTNPTSHISGAIHYPESSFAVTATQKEVLHFISVPA